MAAVVARMHRAQHASRLLASHLPASHSICTPIHRHAMMSAFSPNSMNTPPPLPRSKPTMGETPSMVVPSTSRPSAKDLSADAASPQVAARPPPVPKAERPRPKIRAAKAAITMVCNLYSITSDSMTHSTLTDTSGCGAITSTHEESYTSTFAYRRA